MKRILISLTIALAALIAGTSSASAHPKPRHCKVVVRPARVVVRPARVIVRPVPVVKKKVVVAPKRLWIPGHWQWRGIVRGYVWIPGHWR